MSVVILSGVVLVLIAVVVGFWTVLEALKKVECDCDPGPALDAVWDRKLSSTVETLTSDEILADTLAKMSDAQLDRIAVRTEELRNKNE